MQVQYREEMANYSGPESCVTHREVCGEALAGETGRPAIEPRNQEIGMPTELLITEGNMEHGVNRKPCADPTRSETLRMSGSDLHGSWDISAAPAMSAGGAWKVNNRTHAIYAVEKSDTPILLRKPPNKDRSAEEAEKRGVAKGSVEEFTACRTLNREQASMKFPRCTWSRQTEQDDDVPRHLPKAGALCGNSARRDLCGGQGVTSVPTATGCLYEVRDLQAGLQLGFFVPDLRFEIENDTRCVILDGLHCPAVLVKLHGTQDGCIGTDREICIAA